MSFRTFYNFRIAQVTFSEKLSEHWNDKINENWKETYAYDIPGIHVYMTSEDNAYGIIDSIWKNGEELILKPDTWLTVFKLNTIKYKYLAMSSNCSSDSYKTCLMEKLLGTDYEKRFGCSNTCLALSTFDHSSLEPEISRVIYDSVWNRKNYFENIAFLNFQ